MTGTLLDFIRESNRIESIQRDPTNAEVAAHRDLLALHEIQVRDLENFVKLVQPGAVLRREKGMNVRVGNHIPPPGGHEIEVRLTEILRGLSRGSYETHLQYETLHPFTDGNGRSGRALWLWQMGGYAPIGFLHHFYYQTLDAIRESRP